MSERDAITERSRDALRQAREIFEKGNPDDGRLKFERARALDILDSCNHAGVPPPTELVALFAVIFRFPEQTQKRMQLLGDYGFEKMFEAMPHNRDGLNACILREARAVPDPSGNNPSTTTIDVLKELAGVGEKTIYRWRRNQNYRQAVAELRQMRQMRAEVLRGERAVTKLKLRPDTNAEAC